MIGAGLPRGYRWRPVQDVGAVLHQKRCRVQVLEGSERTLSGAHCKALGSASHRHQRVLPLRYAWRFRGWRSTQGIGAPFCA